MSCDPEAHDAGLSGITELSTRFSLPFFQSIARPQAPQAKPASQAGEKNTRNGAVPK